jgi:DNA-binding MarR family transcriptional regulator
VTLPAEACVLTAIEDALMQLAIVGSSRRLHVGLLRISALPGDHPARRLDHRGYLVMRHISRHERSAQHEIAVALDASRATLSRRVARLEALRLVRREPHRAISYWRHLYDHRSPWIEPTVEGHLAFENVQLLRTAYLTTRLRDWSAADLHAASRLLARLAHDLHVLPA